MVRLQQRQNRTKEGGQHEESFADDCTGIARGRKPGCSRGRVGCVGGRFVLSAHEHSDACDIHECRRGCRDRSRRYLHSSRSLLYLDYPEQDSRVTFVGVGAGAAIVIAATADLPVINEGSLTIRNLTLTEQRPGSFGEIVYNQGTFIMGRNSVVTGGLGAPGIMNFNTVIMDANSRVTGNSNTGPIGSGAFEGNRGGVYNFAGSSLIMNDRSRISGNTASHTGGGVYNEAGATFEMNSQSRVVGNTPNNVFTPP